MCATCSIAPVRSGTSNTASGAGELSARVLGARVLAVRPQAGRRPRSGFATFATTTCGHDVDETKSEPCGHRAFGGSNNWRRLRFDDRRRARNGAGAEHPGGVDDGLHGHHRADHGAASCLAAVRSRVRQRVVVQRHTAAPDSPRLIGSSALPANRASSSLGRSIR